MSWLYFGVISQGTLVVVSITAAATVFAAYATARQIGANQAIQREKTAKEMWKDYLKLALQYPELAYPRNFEEFKSDPRELERYEWFVSYLLETMEEILTHAPGERERWERVTLLEFSYHKNYFDDIFWKKEFSAVYTDDMKDLIRKACNYQAK